METMTQEDKDLLIKDLCARLSYGVKVKLGDNPNIFDLEYRIKFAVMYGDSDKLEDILDITNIKPYLFPLSSITEEQRKELNKCIKQDYQKEADNFVNNISNGIMQSTPMPNENVIEFYYKNHIDYRGLIPKRLAIDATGLNIY